MTKMQFTAATQRVQEEETEEGDESSGPDILEFSLGGQDFKLSAPTTTQVVLLATATDEGNMRALLSGSMAFLEGLFLDDGYRRFRKLMAKGVVTTDLLIGGDEDNEKGIIDWVVGHVSDGRPPKPSTVSSASPATGGRRSTGRAPGKGSIPSDSPSGAS